MKALSQKLIPCIITLIALNLLPIIFLVKGLVVVALIIVLANMLVSRFISIKAISYVRAFFKENGNAIDRKELLQCLLPIAFSAIATVLLVIIVTKSLLLGLLFSVVFIAPIFRLLSTAVTMQIQGETIDDDKHAKSK